MRVYFNYWLRNAVARATVRHIPLLLLQSSRLSAQVIQFFPSALKNEVNRNITKIGTSSYFTFH